MAKPWPERPVSAANKSGKQQVTRRQGGSFGAPSQTLDGSLAGLVQAQRAPVTLCPLPYAETGSAAGTGGCDDGGMTWVIC
jgi:hypothetical protein